MDFARLRLAARPAAPGLHAGLTALLCFLAALLGCGGAPTPEQQVRAALAALEDAAERGDASAFADGVSAAYSDPYGHDREKLRAFVAFHLMQSGRGREVVVRVRDVSVTDESRAVVALALGLAGARGSRGLAAEVYAVDLDLVREGEAWRVSWARSRRAPATDLL